MSRYKNDERFDFNNLLDLKKCQVVQGSSAGLWDDNTLVLRWTIPHGSDQQAREWVYANRQVLTDVELPFRLLEGPWRTVQCRVKPQDAPPGRDALDFEQVIAKGYYTEIDWDAARIFDVTRAQSNTKSAGVTNSASDNPQYVMVVRFPYCSPDSVVTMTASLSSNEYAPSIRGQSLGTLKNIFATAKMEEDGSYSILLTLARPQYTLQAYTDLGGDRQNDVYYLWNVPKQYAQQILDGWKAANPVGSSATADYGDDRKLVSIILRKNALAKPNLSISDIWVTCDTKQAIHFAWGYQKVDVDAFINAHKAKISGGGRRVDVNSRGDGLYDITITENYVEAETPPHFTITVYNGSKIRSRQEYGWNINHTQLTAVKSLYADRFTDGYTYQFRVTRDDQCTFDYEAVVLIENPHVETIDVTGTGVTTKARSVRGGTPAEIASVQSDFKADRRKRTSVRLEAQENGLVGIQAQQDTVIDTPRKEIAGAGARKLVFGNNTDNPPNLGASALQSGVASAADDGTIGYGVWIKDLTKLVRAIVTINMVGVDRVVEAQASGSTTDVPSNVGGGVGVESRVSLRPDDDGSLSWVHEKDTFKPIGPHTARGGTSLFSAEFKEAENVQSGALPTSTPADGKRIRPQFVIDPVNGKIRLSVIEETAHPSSEIVDLEITPQFRKTITRQRNAPASYGGPGTPYGSSSGEITDTNRIDRIKETLELNPQMGQVMVQSSAAEKKYEWIDDSLSLSTSNPVWKNRSDGTGQYKSKEVGSTKRYQRKGYRYRTIITTVTESYSLTRPAASAASLPSSEGVNVNAVDMLGNGLWVSRTTSITATDWSPIVWLTTLSGGGLPTMGSTRVTLDEDGNIVSGAMYPDTNFN